MHVEETVESRTADERASIEIAAMVERHTLEDMWLTQRRSLQYRSVVIDALNARVSQLTEQLRVERQVNAVLRRQLHVAQRGK